MIALHRLTHPEQTFLLNPDLIQTVEATPDTVISLTNASKFIVHEKPSEVVELIRAWRGSIVSHALGGPAIEAGELAEVVHLAGSRPEACE
ncbi:MAG TPA: flagellar FlbD family protein [Gaiellaceae bacterium]|jgi:flagellar protein FlbD